MLIVKNFLSATKMASLVYERENCVATIERELKFRKRMAFSVLGSLRTVPLHSTLAVNNLGLKFVS